MLASYPARESYWSHRFCRLLTKAAVANEIGAEACWMLTVIAHQEDAKRYRGAVTYFNEQLMPLCAIKTHSRLIRVRNRAIEAGWLHYEPGGKGKAGRYWCVIPKEFEDVSDGPMDEGIPTDLRFQNGSANGGKKHPNREIPLSKMEAQTERKRSANANHSTLSLDPIPKEPPNPLSGGRNPVAKATWKIRKRDMENTQRLDAWILKNLPPPHSENLRIKVLACAIHSMRNANRNPTRMFLAMLEKGLAGEWTVPDEDIQAASRQIVKHKAQNPEPESISEILRRRNGT